MKMVCAGGMLFTAGIGACLALAGLQARAGVVATGGTMTNYIEEGFSYAAHIFTNSGTFTVAAGGEVEVLVVAGGGGGGETIGGGGGGGGLIYTNAYALSAGIHSVTVGAGGAGGWGTGYPAGTKGGDSAFATLTAVGGGAGGGFNVAAVGVGGSAGGNGAGGGARAGYTPSQGNDGGIGDGGNAGGGGGGAGQAGAAGVSGVGGKGGDGQSHDLAGAATDYAGGGGGGTRTGYGAAGAGGAGGGGAGGTGGNPGSPGVDNTGGGGGGGGFTTDMAGGKGGSGIVIVRYLLDMEGATIVNGPATNILANSAFLTGSLLSTGASATAVTAYWGTTNAGTNGAEWAESATLAAPQMPGSASLPATGLTADLTYYYRLAASNDAGVAWASATACFITGEVAINLASNACETTLTPGAFTVSRPGTTTNEALTVSYAQTGGTAVSGVDFTALNGTVVIPAGKASADILVTPLKNHAVTNDTTVQLTLTGAQAISGAADSATMTIVNEPLRETLYVSQAGDGSDGLTWATAFTSLQPALDLVAGGGTIHVAGGQTFALAAAALWPAHDAITLRGGYEADPDSEPGANNPAQWPTVIKTLTGINVRLLTIDGVSGATLENLTFRDGRERINSHGGAVYANAVSGLTIRNCRFLRNSVIVGGNGYGGGLAAVSCSGLITNSVFLGNFAATTTGHGTDSRGGAIYLSGGAWTLRDLLIQGNWTAAGSGAYRGSGFDMAGGIYLGGVGAVFVGKNLMVVNNDGGGIMLAAGTATLENLTVSGNDLSGISVAAGAASGTTIRNSILYGNRDDFSGTAPKLHYNIIGDGTQAGNNGNLAGDPAFAFPLFYLADGSPALNSGTGTVSEAGLVGTTVQASGAADSGTVSRGYHFASGVGWDLDLHVAPGGSGNGLSVGNPLGSITAALAQAEPRTRIHIAAGTYTKTTETFPLTVEGKAIQLLGTNAAVTIIDAASSGQRVVHVSETPLADNRIEGLTLRGGATSLGGAGVAVDCATLTVADTIIRNNTATVPGYSYQFGGGGMYAISATLFMEGTEFLNNVAANSAGHVDGRAGGFEAWSGVTLRLRNSVFSGNITRKSGGTSYSLYAGGGVWLGRGFFQLRNLLLVNNIGGGVLVSASSGIGNGAASPGISMLENLTAYGNNAEGIRVDASAASMCSLRNSITWTNVVADLGGTLPASIVYNCIGDGVKNGIDHNFDDAPLFVNAAGGDFRLQSAYGRLDEDGRLVRDSATSPCIDTGTNQLWMADAVDLSGLPRIQQGRPGPKPHRVDIGAYESPVIPPSGTLLLVR